MIFYCSLTLLKAGWFIFMLELRRSRLVQETSVVPWDSLRKWTNGRYLLQQTSTVYSTE
jgi:hypothetical protein